MMAERTVLYAPDGSRYRFIDSSNVDAALASGEWVRAPGVMVYYEIGPDRQLAVVGRRLLTESEALAQTSSL